MNQDLSPRCTRWARRLLPALLFLVAFLPRLLQPVSRPLVWYLRSAHFYDALLAGDWANTVYSEHPGVTVMWLAGAGLRLYWALSGVTPAASSVPPDFEPIHFFGPVPVAEIGAGLAPLALAIALGITGAFFLLRRLFGQPVAAVAGFLLALSPYHLAQSKVLHLDGLLATLMLLSALALLVYCREQRERHARWLLLSAGLGGLALLTKTAALFLVPFCGLVLLVDGIRRAARGAQRGWRTLFVSLLPPLASWLLVALLLYVAAWPVMWVEPARGLAAVERGLVYHAGTAHDTPTFFMGEATLEDPGPVFNLVVLFLRSGEIELLFLGMAALLGAAHLLRRRRLPENGIDHMLLLAYAFFFLAQMSLAAKKMPRYVLPALASLDVLAAAAVVAWARGLARGRRRLAPLLMALPLLVQAALVFPAHPYYGTLFNRLAGGPQAAARSILIGEEGEGLAELAADLNARAGAGDLVVASQIKHVFNQTFTGTTLDIDEGPADYLVFHHNNTVRDYKAQQWGDLWERYAARTPEREVVFGGVPYAWLYPALPAGGQPERPLPLILGAGYAFAGYDLRDDTASPGEPVPLVLYWQATEPVAADLSVFVHLAAVSGELVWQDDGAANHGARPTWSWAPGETVLDPHTVALPRDLPEGDYVLTAGLYDWQTGERLPVSSPSGAPAGDRVELATLAVHRPRAEAATWIALGAAALVLLSAVPALRGSDE